jgi:hypothetical protein
MRCESCGAQLPNGQTNCEYCGSTWDRAIPAEAVDGPSEGNPFDQIKQSAAWAARNSPSRQASLPRMPVLAAIAPMIFFVIFIGGAGFMAFMMLGVAGIFGAVGFSHGGAFGAGVSIIPAFMAIVPIGFIVLGVFMFLKFRTKMTDFQNSPTRAHAALIAGKRTQVSGGGQNSSASTSYFITAEFEDGRR